MELGSDRAEREARLKAEIAEEFPDLDVVRVWGVGWRAVPAGTVVVEAVELDMLKRKLEKRRDEAQG